MKEMKIIQAINEVMREVGYVQKQRGAGLNYTYAGERALIEALRPALVDAGIVVVPVDTQRIDDTYSTARGSIMNRCIVRVTYRFYHLDGSYIDAVVTGEGADVGDKSGNKAMTGALKYALRQTFVIETGDDPDSTAIEPRAEKPPAIVDAPPPGEALRKAFHAAGSSYYGKDWDVKRAALVKHVTGGRTTSSSDLNAAEMKKLLDGINAKADGAL